MIMENIKIGFAKDIHKLVKNRPLMLGGIKIPSDVGEEAHSDGDVVLHALSEAMLGALSLGDLGKYFPPNDNKYKNIKSSIILNEVYKMICIKGFHIINIDISIELELIKLKNHIEDIRNSIAKLLDIDVSLISIKANTNEGFDAVGRGEAIIATCVLLLGK